MQITPNMPQIIVNLVQFLDKLTKYNVPFFSTPIQTNYNIIAKTVRKYYDKEGKEYDSTILEHINRNDGRMGSAYAALLRRNLIVAPDEWDLAKINDLSYKIKQVLNFLEHLTTGKYSEDTVVYYESRESRGKIMDNKSKLIYLHVPTMIKLVIDPIPNPKSNLCDIVTCYTLNGYSSIQNEFINCTIPYSLMDLDTLFKSEEDSRTWKNFVADAMRIEKKKEVIKPTLKKVVSKPVVLEPNPTIVPCQSPIFDFLNTDQFAELYREAKSKRNLFDKTKNIGLSDLNDSAIDISQYDKFANICTANVLLSFFNNTLEGNVYEFVWEYSLSPIKNNGVSIPNPLNRNLCDLIQKAGGNENITSYLIDYILDTEYDCFSKEMKFLNGTNFSIKYYSNSGQLNYLVIPFRCLKDFYLLRALNKATICVENREHDKKDKKKVTECDLLNDFNYFNSKLSNALIQAKKVLKSKYLP